MVSIITFVQSPQTWKKLTKKISQFTKLEHAVISVTSLLHNPSNRSQEMPHSNGWRLCQPGILMCGSFLTRPCSCPPKGYRYSFIFSTALRNWFYLRLPWFLQIKKSESEVAQPCLTLCDPMDCSLPGSSIHEIFQARVLEWVAISFSRGSSRPRDRTQVSCIAGKRFIIWATRQF